MATAATAAPNGNDAVDGQIGKVEDPEGEKYGQANEGIDETELDGADEGDGAQVFPRLLGAGRAGVLARHFARPIRRRQRLTER